MEHPEQDLSPTHATGGPTSPHGACAECGSDAAVRYCRQCLQEAQSCAGEDAYVKLHGAVHELHAGLDDCAVDVPDEWTEKPLARFTGEHDEGDSSVGIGPRSAWVLAADQEGTILGDYLARPRTEAIGVRAVDATSALDMNALLESLKDPATLHVLMLRGTVAVPSWRDLVHLRGEVPNGEDAQLARIAQLQEQIVRLGGIPGLVDSPDYEDGHDHEGFPGGCERFGHTPDTCPDRTGEQPWIACADRLPTAADADSIGDVLWRRSGESVLGRLTSGTPMDATHWRRTDRDPTLAGQAHE